jgi:pantoate--beta-alanine ligase
VKVVVERSELEAELAAVRAGGRTLALVPTMGALHDGHRELIRRAAGLADTVVVSIFLNPLQFAPGEDLERYPRTLDADVELCTQAGADLVLAPTVAAMYPAGEPHVRVSAGPLGAVLEGASRPGHFDGVLTVVAKLFGLVRPQVAVFGAKDAQQLALVRRMVVDLDLPLRIEAAPTVREPDGLALSSRNRYLDADGRAAAAALSRALWAGSEAAAQGPGAVVAAARAVLSAQAGVQADYVVLVDAETFGEEPAGAAPGRPALLLVAARVGGTRLIDNMPVGFPVGGTQ